MVQVLTDSALLVSVRPPRYGLRHFGAYSATSGTKTGIRKIDVSNK